MKIQKEINFDDIDRKILNILQTRFPLVVFPFQNIAQEINITEDEVIKRLQNLKKKKIIRRIAPIIDINYFNGYSTLVALKVKKENIKNVSKIINEYPEVSHNYLRDYDLNMWFTLSSINEKKALDILNELKTKLKCDLLNLPTCNKFKINVNFLV